MKISTMDLREMLNAKVTVDKKDTSASKDQFGKLINKSIVEKERKTAFNSEEKVSSTEEEMPVEETIADNNNESNVSNNIVDISLLMKLLTMQDFINSTNDKDLTVNSISGMLGNTDFSSMKSLLDLASTLTGKQDTKDIVQALISNKDNSGISDILNLLLKEDAFANNEGSNSSLDTIKNSISLQKLATDVISDTIENTLASKAGKVDSLITKDNTNDQSIQLNAEVSEEVKTVQNNLSSNEESLQDSFTKQKSDSENTDSMSSELESKEDKVLKNIISSDNKTEGKLVAFPTHLSRLKDVSMPVQNVSEPMVVNSGNIINDVAKVIKYMNNKDLKELTIKITPQDLGEMTIKITMEGNLLKASISASNKDTYSLLNSNASDIKNSLNNSQIKVQDVAINIYNEDTTFFSSSFERNGQQFGEQGRRSSQSGRTVEVEDKANLESKQKIDAIDSNLSILA